MHDYKAVEETRLRDCPRLVAATTIVLVDYYDCDGVDGCDSDGNLPIQSSIVESMIDTKWSSKSALIFWWREGERI